MTDSSETLFEAVRRAAGAVIWSRGVDLCRVDAVVGEGESANEVRFCVATKGGLISPRVTFFVDDIEWDCECSSRAAACEHVAAAAIAWRRSRESGAALPAPRGGTARVAYRFRRAIGGLELVRVLARDDGQERPIETTLAAIAGRRFDGARLVATQADLAVDLALGGRRQGPLPAAVLQRLMFGLSRCGDVTLDGQAIRASGDSILPVVVVADHPDGFQVRLESHTGVVERFANGAALVDGRLHPTREPSLTAREREDLQRGLTFGIDRAAELVTRFLPGLAGRVPIEVRSTRLPDARPMRPYIKLDLERDGRTLSILPTLVYGEPPTARVDGGKLTILGATIPVRDEAEERRLAYRLQQLLGLVPGSRTEFTGEEAVAFAAKLDRWEGGPVDSPVRRHFRLSPPLVPRFAVRDDGFDLAFESPVGDPTAPGTARAADSAEVLRAWRAGESLVSLSGGGWAPIPQDWLARFGSRIQDLLNARRADGGLPRAAGLDLASLCVDLDLPPPECFETLRRVLDDFSGLPAATLPIDLATSLRDYQRRGVDWLCFLRDAGLGALLADDMGLGKTLQVLCALQGRTLVVCPTSVLANWGDEIRRHRPALRAQVYHGARRELDPTADVTLTTYAILRLDAERLAGTTWDSLVLDEAQNIKNPESQTAAAAFTLQARFRVAMTGTPVENRLDELWSLFRFVEPGLLGGRSKFEECYSGPIACGENAVATRLRERIRPFLLRRLKRDVARELPPRTEMVLRSELTADERAVYDAVRAATVGAVVERLEAGGNVLEALEALLRLRQAACHPALVPGQQAQGSSKLDLLLETLDSVVAEGHRALVFSQWTSLLDLTEPHLTKSGLGWLRLDGSTKDRGEVVRRFQAEDGPPVLLVSLRAGGTGLNLTAADHVFLLDPWWNPAVEDQAADRAHRIGQMRPVLIYRLVSSDTVEERLIELQQRKRELAAVALEGAEAASGLDRDDLIRLLR